MFLDLLRSMHGPNLLRLKGVVKIAETPQSPLVVHGVQHVFHPPVRLPQWPDGDERTRIVLITRDLEPRVVGRLFDAFLGAGAPTGRTAPRSSTIRWCRSGASIGNRAGPCHLRAGARCSAENAR
jgi:Cobalamin synthesis protein cobW C-terminal domain